MQVLLSRKVETPVLDTRTVAQTVCALALVLICVNAKRALQVLPVSARQLCHPIARRACRSPFAPGCWGLKLSCVQQISANITLGPSSGHSAVGLSPAPPTPPAPPGTQISAHTEAAGATDGVYCMATSCYQFSSPGCGGVTASASTNLDYIFYKTTGSLSFLLCRISGPVLRRNLLCRHRLRRWLCLFGCSRRTEVLLQLRCMWWPDKPEVPP